MADPTAAQPGVGDVPLTVLEYESKAETLTQKQTWDYWATGADAETLFQRTRQGFDSIRLWPRGVLDKSIHVTLGTDICGHHLKMPILIAPSAKHGLADASGELATVRAAENLGTLLILSSWCSEALETICAAAPTVPKWFQLHLHDRRTTLEALQKLERLGFSGVVVCCDARVPGRQLRNARNSFILSPPRMYGLDLGDGPAALQLTAYKKTVRSAISWDDVDWLKAHTKLDIILKGILRADEAREAARRGVKVVIVSNHGGRQLDAAPPAIEALPKVVKALSGTGCIVLLDSGIRWGSDVVRALACGAKGVLVGRPVLWGLAVNGQAGVEHCLGLLRDETARVLALCGCSSPRAAGPWLLSESSETDEEDPKGACAGKQLVVILLALAIGYTLGRNRR